jgi:hypothetical protein
MSSKTFVSSIAAVGNSSWQVVQRRARWNQFKSFDSALLQRESAVYGMLDGKTNCITMALVEDLTSFSFRIPKSLARSIEAAAKRLGLTKSEYARRAMEEFEHRMMQERMAELSQRLAAQSAAAAQTMDASTADGLS